MIERLTRRVVVTGMGLVTPLGTGLEKTWKALCAGKSGIARITRFDPTDYPCQIAGEVPDFDPAAFIEKKEIKKMDLFIHFAVGAAQMAVDDAGLKVTGENADRVGVYIGAGIGGLPAIEHYHKILLEKGAERVSPFFIPMVIINLASGQVAIRLGARGPNSCAVTACATGNHCIGDAFRLIQRGDADVMLAGGTEAAITPLGVAGFAAARALSRRNDDPAHASRPFDRDRDGFVLGEGAGVVVLEELETARRRGARIYGEVVGYAMNSDAHHITAPPDDGEGAIRCMEMAIKDAGVSKDEIGYINAHATSTFADKVETQAIKGVFGDRAYRIPVSSTKSMIGHLLGAAGGVEAVFSLLAIHRGVVPPTINLEHPDPECDLDYVPGRAREVSVKVALSNSFGFGGVNACLLFKRMET
ncbi:MAG: beta-ketoacyl-ACP synthase II [Nitrospirae bacterium]|nr:MAG: beta-ketoacyl-[acyl-carrier-protein] synthase II [Nitrospirae bacterium 13_2_20CM_62_7]OLB55182.1 MAG: beta-ketoacyl-[acyl-carrier-protein] synthase II [Nitrospirae bacterium 13_2_20CM_2_62_8]OLC81715.1 MAG: beta-ketoacyl-[acyl-carrier-protein] synthase II [Nitrospirae bacterium 13_1_40CM_3_62_11]OLD37469.1 MAG: beta-ketoacyl-[acyl-carrier-protein] synthase II [Nitrospirae bacterium 13_1_40CM_2_62_10]TLY40322.1 MAG: beta-ketoacyl-ACP synthase II [Nitrospirota bacterium]